MNNYTIQILHLYPDLLNLYGDKGNLSALASRLRWRGIDVTVTQCYQDDTLDISGADIIVLGGGSDREQEVVCKLLQQQKQALKDYVEAGSVLLATCGGYPLLGKYIKTADARMECLGILDITTEPADNRLISDVIVQSELVDQPICGFENHATYTHIGSHTPLGKVLYGNGNNKESGYEGVVYKNVFATYLHGPLLPKNPKLCDTILLRALKHKYPDFDALTPLNDELENLANAYITATFGEK